MLRTSHDTLMHFSVFLVAVNTLSSQSHRWSQRGFVIKRRNFLFTLLVFHKTIFFHPIWVNIQYQFPISLACCFLKRLKYICVAKVFICCLSQKILFILVVQTMGDWLNICQHVTEKLNGRMQRLWKGKGDGPNESF